MIDLSMRRVGAFAAVLAICSAAALASSPARAQDGSAVLPEVVDARQDLRADTRDLRQEFRAERREDIVDWQDGAYDSRGEFVRDRAGDRGSARQQHRIDRRDFRQDLRQIRN